jgi:hypothetical protein
MGSLYQEMSISRTTVGKMVLRMENFENFVIHRRRRFCHVGELNVENEINVLNLRYMKISIKSSSIDGNPVHNSKRTQVRLKKNLTGGVKEEDPGSQLP